MKALEPTFLRRFQVFVAIESGARSQSILEKVEITLGFTGPVDRDSGMILNLVDIDSWIYSFKKTYLNRSYTDRWEFCRLARLGLRKLIKKSEFKQVHFLFHDLFVKLHGRETLFGWQTYSQMKSENVRWWSLITLTLKPVVKAWPPVTKAQEAGLLKRLRALDLKSKSLKGKWDLKGTKRVSFEYVDPTSSVKIRIL